MSWMVEVRVHGDPKYYGNAVRLETVQEAALYAHDLFMRWTQADAVRHVPSNDPVNYRFTEKGLEAIDDVHPAAQA